MSPLPLAAIPVTEAVLSLVQSKDVPLTLPLNAIVVIALAGQIVWLAGVATALGVGFTVQLTVIAFEGGQWSDWRRVWISTAVFPVVGIAVAET